MTSSDRVTLPSPPDLPEREGVGATLMTAIPMLGSVGAIVLVATMSRATGGRSLIAGGLFLLSAIGFVAVQLDRQRGQRRRLLRSSRAAHQHRLAEARAKVRAAAEAERREKEGRHPPPVVLAVLAEQGHPWPGAGPGPELPVRWGAADGALDTPIVVPDPGPSADPVAVAANRRLAERQRVQPGLPATIDLRRWSSVAINGPPARSRALARALVCSAAASQPPSLLRIAALVDDTSADEWEWLKWLPHARSPTVADAVGPRRLVLRSRAELQALCRDDGPDMADVDDVPQDRDRRRTPHLLVVDDRGGAAIDLDSVPGHVHLTASARDAVDRPGTTVLTMTSTPLSDHAAPDPRGLTITLSRQHDSRSPRSVDPVACDGVPAVLQRPPADAAAGGTATGGRADQLDRASAEAFARRLAPRKHGAAPESPATGLTDLLGLGRLDRLDLDRLDLARAWRRRRGHERLRVPIGATEDGGPLLLDLKESAEDGMGPHGLVVGATGSGKSELLRTLVLGLALSHHPEQLNLVLVDFKGGATFAGLAELPHTSAVITNLADDLTLVDRMHDALAGELTRRQELLRAAGNLASVRELEAARDMGTESPTMPSLLVVVDEFAELLVARPAMLDVFAAIGRLGRSLGIHLLLASQRLEEGRLRGLDAHLSYRIGLRTFSATESRTVLGVPDAAALPRQPGVGFLRSGPDSLVRFRAAHVSGSVGCEEPVGRVPEDPVRFILPFTAAEVRVPDEVPARATDELPAASASRPDRPLQPPRPREPSAAYDAPRHRSLLDAAVDRLRGRGTPARRIWLPPLDEPDTLDRLCPDLREAEGLGLVSEHWRRRGPLTFPVGVVDRPRDQRRDPLVLSLAGSGGHVAVVGGPRSGRSTLVRTIVAGLALTSTPREVQVHVLDLGGSSAGLAGLPHVATVAGRDDAGVVRQAVAELTRLVDRRQAWFREHGIDGVDAWRARRAANEVDDGHGDVFLVVDGWATLREEHPELEPALLALAERGLGAGVHLVLTANRWAELRAPLRDLLGTRLELRLGDPLDSEVDRRLAPSVPAGRPGRGLATGGSMAAAPHAPAALHALVALPRIDGHRSPDTAGDGLADLVRRVRDAWPGAAAAPLRSLPARATLDEVRARAATDGAHSRDARPHLLLGLDEHDLAPVGLDLAAYPHLLVLGDNGSGKTAALRTLAAEIARAHPIDRARIVAVDPRRALWGELPEHHLLAHLHGPARTAPELADLAAHLAGRLPGPDVTVEQLRARDWWTGAEVFVLVDDQDLVATSGASPLAPLVPLLPQARDVGLHLVVARRAGGAARAMHEPLLQTLRDLAQPVLLLSGDPDEGPVVGRARLERLPPGRGRLVTREGETVLQVAWTGPAG